MTDLRGPDSPAPGGSRIEHLLTARKATVRLDSERDLDAWTYNDTVPGPVITATEGDLIEVRLVNHDIDDGVTLHWHGYGEDGAAGLTRVRLRLINTDSDPHRFTLAGTPFHLAAVDGRELEQPDELSRTGLRLYAAGRHDLVFVMPTTSVALVLDDQIATVWLRPRTGAPDGEASTEEIAAWPELDLLTYGTPASVALRTATPDRHFTMVLDRGVTMVDGSPAYAQTVNGRGHPNIPDQLVTEGDIIRFTVVNRSLETHPWHLHGHSVLVLSRDGIPSTGSPLWVDTFDVRPGEVWEVAFRASNPGIWMNHCHNLPHAHEGMMLRLRYDGFTTPFDGMHPAARDHTVSAPPTGRDR